MRPLPPMSRPRADLRFLEIGEFPFVKLAYPEQTHFFHAGSRMPDDKSGVMSIRHLVEKLRPGAVDLIFCQPQPYPPWHPLALSRMLFNRRAFQHGIAPLRPYALRLLSLFRSTPVAVMDFEDMAFIERSHLALMNRATLYFKRELPPDEWKLFTKTATSKLPSARFRRSRRYRRHVAKLRPLSLGVPNGAQDDLPQAPVDKTTDIFFAGTTAGLPMRERALEELRTLRAEGFLIDIPQSRIDRSEFYRRCAAARLVLSPEGYGWDCFRHYEAGACGSVPLMNVPSIRRYAPQTHGVDAFFYMPEPGGLAAAARRALADPEALSRMSLAASAHVAAHHTNRAIADYVIEETLSATASRK